MDPSLPAFDVVLLNALMGRIGTRLTTRGDGICASLDGAYSALMSVGTAEAMALIC